MRVRSIFVGLLLCVALAATQRNVIAQVPARTGAEAEIQPVLVVGNVMRPTSLVLRQEVTLTRAIAFAGGVKEQSQLVMVRVFRYLEGQPQQMTFSLRTIMNGGASERITIKHGDIIEVSDEFGRFRLPYGIPQISPPSPQWDPPLRRRKTLDC